MNLETKVQGRLWEAVRLSVEARNFSAAILDGIHLLSDVIRERSGLEGDGVSLVGAAFGGASPKLKVSRLQSESEQNVQRGVESLLRGIFQAIRNPRSHGVVQDGEQDAVAILLFIDYLLKIVDQAKSPFSLAAFVARIADQDFVPSTRYAELLADDVPTSKRLAVCRELFARRGELNGEKTRHFFAAMIGRMSDSEVAELCELVSDELRGTDDEATIRFVLGAIPSLWSKFHEVARIRIENKLIKAIQKGSFAEDAGRCTAGVLGTWATQIIDRLTLRSELWRAVFAKLQVENRAEQQYAFAYFTAHIVDCFDKPTTTLVWIVKNGLRNGDRRFKDLADGWRFGPEGERPSEDAWRAPFLGALESFTEVERTDAPEDDIPF